MADETAQSEQATPAPKAKRTRGGSKLPATVRNAARTGIAANLCKAIASHLGLQIPPKAFRDTLRRKHGYVSGKHGSKLALTDTVAKSMLEHYADVKRRRSSK